MDNVHLGAPYRAARFSQNVDFRLDGAGRHMMAIGGRLPGDVEQTADVMVIDVTVMDGDRRREVRAEVVARILAAPAEACGARTEQKAEAIRTALGARAMRVT